MPLGLFLHSNRGYARQSWKIGHDGIVLENSFIGESEELIKILPHIKLFGVEIIGMAKDEKRRFSDALAVCLMKMRNFKTENFANFYPAGV